MSKVSSAACPKDGSMLTLKRFPLLSFWLIDCNDAFIFIANLLGSENVSKLIL